MNTLQLSLFAILFLTLNACYAPLQSGVNYNTTSPKYADIYRPYLDEGSTLVGVGFHWMRERTATRQTIFKQFYPDTRQITHYITYDNGKKNGQYAEWYDNGNQWKEGEYKNDVRVGIWKNYHFATGTVSEYGAYEAGERAGTWIRLDQSGNKQSSYEYVDGKKDGAYEIWNDAGTLIEKGTYKKDELIESETYLAEEKEIFRVVEEMPYVKSEACEDYADNELQFKECSERALLTSLYQSIRYPEIARQNGLEGMALVQFTVEKDGSMSDIEVLRGLCEAITMECLNAVENIPEWMPGKQAGEPVRVRFTLPIRYKLQ
ncbi:MAG: TonB family protein [Bacteroidota bacterium]